jgi:pimeloyl-ACP methyl ester carboxylesterase
MHKTIFKLICSYILLVYLGAIVTTQTHAFSPGQETGSSRVHPKHQQEIVVLIHGLMRSSWSMYPLKKDLEREGYQVYYYSYSSAKYTIHQHGLDLKQFIVHLLIKSPNAKIHFITHSLGGIIAREALFQLNSKQLNNMGCLIMLAPPNQGSKLAKFSTQIFPMFTFPIKPLAELSSDDNSYVHRVPIPKVKIGIIAGRYDAKVPPESARLKGQAVPVVINTNHMFIMSNATTKILVKRFLEKGTFDE